MKNKSLMYITLVMMLAAINVFPGQCRNKSPWQITVKDTTDYVGITLANGRIGILPSSAPFRSESIILNNVYEKESELGVSRLLKGINFANLEMSIDGDPVNKQNISDWRQTLDMKEARLTTSFRFKDKAIINYTIYALRGMQYVGFIDVSVQALKKINLSVSGNIDCPGNYNVRSSSYRRLQDSGIIMPVLQTVAESPFKKYTIAATATFIFSQEYPPLQQIVKSAHEHQLNFKQEVCKSDTCSFAWTGATCTTQDFSDPQNESERMVIYLMRGNKKARIERHKELWNRLWQGDIVIEGDWESQRDVRLALYHLYAFSRDDSDLSIAPMGLSSLNYNGHIFWDTELWMFPPLLIFNQDIARSLLNYRSDRLDKARQKAKNYGYSGAMFPWESDDTGEEATPTWALTGAFEHHITADIGIAFWNYFRVTRDTVWLREKGFPLICEVADFWVSRACKNDDGSYSIKNVVGADEFAHNVNDNAFTNGAAKTILGYASKAARVAGVNPDIKWKEVEDNLKFYYFPDGVMKEYEQYDGDTIKQADVNLLAYPLQIIRDDESVRKDLAYYESRIAADGPAMGYSVLSIINARLGNRKKAFELFKKAYIPNKRPPFGALAESAFSNNPYFATGAGGLLQAVIFGFAGLNLTDHGIEQMNPCLPENWTKLQVKGVGPDKKTFTIE
jgi:trehalose/maltose hydrolase-like predicted phosphorylase